MLSEQQIQALVVRSAKGDSEAFGQIYDEYSQKVFNFILSRVRHKPTAEDLLHTIFLKAWNSVPRYRPSARAKFSTWLFQIANFTIIDHWRSNKETVGIEKFENLTAFSVDPKLYENYEYLWEAMSELPDDYQTILLLRFINDQSVSETAAAMGKSEIGTRVMQHRALKALRKIMEKNGHDLI